MSPARRCASPSSRVPRSRIGARAPLCARDRQSVADGHDLSAIFLRSIRKSFSPTSVAGDDQTAGGGARRRSVIRSPAIFAPPGARQSCRGGGGDAGDLRRQFTVVEGQTSTFCALDDVLTHVLTSRPTAGTSSTVLVNADGTPSIKFNYAPEIDPGAYFRLRSARSCRRMSCCCEDNGPSPGGRDGASVKSSAKRARPSAPSPARARAPSPRDQGGHCGDRTVRRRRAQEGQKLPRPHGRRSASATCTAARLIAGDSGITAAVALFGRGQYVPVDIRNIRYRGCGCERG